MLYLTSNKYSVSYSPVSSAGFAQPLVLGATDRELLGPIKLQLPKRSQGRNPLRQCADALNQFDRNMHGN